MTSDQYTLEDAERDIADLRGKADRLSEVLTKNDSTDPPNSPAGGIIHYSTAGHHKYASADGGTYNTGRATVITSATTLINQLTDINITGLSFPVGIGTYLLTGVVRGVNGSVIARQAVGLNGPAASAVNVDVKIYDISSNTFDDISEITALGTRAGMVTNRAAGALFVCEYDGLITFTAAGTLVITGSCVTAAADTWTAQTRSRMNLMPVT